MSFSTIRKRIEKQYRIYLNNVCLSKKHLKRVNWLKYLQEHDNLFEVLNSNCILNESEAMFLEDQKTSRSKTISTYFWETAIEEDQAEESQSENDEINNDNVDMQMMVVEQEEQEAMECVEEVVSDEEVCEEIDAQNYFSLRSGKRTKAVPTNTNSSTQIRLRIGIKKFAQECLEAIVSMNTKCHVTVNQARECFLLAENIFNGQNFKMQAENAVSVPRSAIEYEAYRNVIPSEKTVWNHRHHFALSEWNFYVHL